MKSKLSFHWATVKTHVHRPMLFQSSWVAVQLCGLPLFGLDWTVWLSGSPTASFYWTVQLRRKVPFRDVAILRGGLHVSVKEWKWRQKNQSVWIFTSCNSKLGSSIIAYLQLHWLNSNCLRKYLSDGTNCSLRSGTWYNIWKSNYVGELTMLEFLVTWIREFCKPLVIVVDIVGDSW